MSERRTVRFDDLEHFKFLSAPKFSPDGTMVAYSIARADFENDSYETDLWLCDPASRVNSQLTFSHKDGPFAWSRDGRAVYFVSKREGAAEKGSLYYLPIHGGEARKLYDFDCEVSEIMAMPDSTILIRNIFIPEERNLENAEYHTYSQIPFWKNGKGFTGQSRNALSLLDFKNGEMKRLTPEKMEVGEFCRTHDSSVILFCGAEYDKIEPQTNSVYSLNVKNGEMECLSGDLEYSFKTAGYCGDRLIVLASDMQRYGLNENAKIFELKGGVMIPLAPGLDTSFHNSIVGDCRYGVKGQYGIVRDDGFYYISTDRTVSRIHRNDLDGHDEILTDDISSADCFDVHRGRLVTVGFKGLGLQELYYYDDVEDHCLTAHNAPFMDTLKLSEPVHYEVDNGEGLPLDCWYMKPVYYEEGRKYPVIFDVHGGPKATYGSIYFHEAQCWAALGYAVIFCNPRGGDGRGNEFADIRGEYGRKDYNDFTAMLDYSVEHFDFLDKDRMGITGGSYGGYTTNWMITQTDRFKCAATQRCISNWVSMAGVSDIGYFFGPDQNAGSCPWTDLDAMWNCSPLKYVKNVKTPTLFIHSDEDHRCPDEQAFQMYTALQMLGVETKLCYFLGENHELSRSGKPRNRLARLREITEWMDRYLKEM